MTTFSQLVDRLAKEIVRPDMVSMLPAYLNQTIRDVHVNASTNMPVFFDDNRKEEEILVDSLTDLTGAFVWPLPKPTQLQQVESVFYRSIGRYVYKGNPKTSLMGNPMDPNGKYFWYRIANTLVFSCVGSVGSGILISWFEYPRSLVYFLPTARPAIYNEETDSYSYKAGEVPLLALEKSTNWILQRHTEMLAEGVRAKAYKRMADEGRARMAYSQFESARLGMQNSEGLVFETKLSR